MENINIVAIFLTGLFTGGLTCMAVQGGLLATTVANRIKNYEPFGKAQDKSGIKGQRKHVVPILAFLIAKLIAYTWFGFILGWVGSLFKFSISMQVMLQLTVAIFMVGIALNMLEVHPIFRYFVIQPPKFLTRMVRHKSKSSDLFAPALLGAFTIFIPCGVTQGMMALAIASGSPFIGATVLFAFVLGTSPVFFILGYFTAKLGDIFQKRFATVAAYAIILLAAWNINSSIALTGSNFTLQSLWNSVICTVSFCDTSPVFARSLKSDSIGLNNQPGPVSEATITIDSRGYTPSNLTVRKGSTVTLRLVNNGGGGCAQAFTIPKLNIQKVVPLGSDTIQFTAPPEPGELAFMCSMGMYRGTIRVI